MKNIIAGNVNEALKEGIQWLRVAGFKEQSRNGPVVVAPGPVCTTYSRPCQRVLFNPVRDANPVFHLMESIWMLAGQSDVKFLLPFNFKFGQYAEDDGHVHGAYGHRWRNYFDCDQLQEIIGILRSNPESRQAVMQMWSADIDLGASKRDIPCNTHIYFDCRGGPLNMTVCCRSNDVLWGAYGANVVHMSMLQEVIAKGIGAPVGVYRQFSNNFHAYSDNATVEHFLENGAVCYDDYSNGRVTAMPLIAEGEKVADFLHDCEVMAELETDEAFPHVGTEFFNVIAAPLREMYLDRREGTKYARVDIVDSCPGNDWLEAFADWCERRDVK